MYKHALIPVALDPDHIPTDALAVARRLLEEGGRVTAIHVIEPLPGYVSQYMPEEVESRRIEGLTTQMQAAFANDDDVALEVIRGNPGRSIVEYASHHKVDLIVVASHRPGFQDYLLGSTAGRIVRHAQCCVHVLR